MYCGYIILSQICIVVHAQACGNWWSGLHDGGWTLSHGEVIRAGLVTGNITLSETAALEQSWAAWGQSLRPIDQEPVITSPVIPN